MTTSTGLLLPNPVSTQEKRVPRILLDEPLGALDLKLRQEMQYELIRMKNELGITFVYVTHDQEEALTMSYGVQLPFVWGHIGNVLTVENNAAGVGMDKTAENPQGRGQSGRLRQTYAGLFERRPAAAYRHRTRSEQGDKFILVNFQFQVVQDHLSVEGFGDMFQFDQFFLQKRCPPFLKIWHALFTHMTIAENIAFGLKIKNKPKSYIEEKRSPVRYRWIRENRSAGYSPDS